jgi:hypothetical protein
MDWSDEQVDLSAHRVSGSQPGQSQMEQVLPGASKSPMCRVISSERIWAIWGGSP